MRNFCEVCVEGEVFSGKSGVGFSGFGEEGYFVEVCGLDCVYRRYLLRG